MKKVAKVLVLLAAVSLVCTVGCKKAMQGADTKAPAAKAPVMVPPPPPPPPPAAPVAPAAPVVPAPEGAK